MSRSSNSSQTSFHHQKVLVGVHKHESKFTLFTTWNLYRPVLHDLHGLGHEGQNEIRGCVEFDSRFGSSFPKKGVTERLRLVSRTKRPLNVWLPYSLRRVPI
jgi:hypothetical protein